MYKLDLALNNLERLIYHKTPTNQLLIIYVIGKLDVI